MSGILSLTLSLVVLTTSSTSRSARGTPAYWYSTSKLMGFLATGMPRLGIADRWNSRVMLTVMLMVMLIEDAGRGCLQAILTDDAYGDAYSDAAG